ncbi:MAG: hypothetical protein JST54_11490 [Deltaproteobacteria bacterium]|nr:hypothetical protein [Deltaproteobacteria bacterium]
MWKQHRRLLQLEQQRLDPRRHHVERDRCDVDQRREQQHRQLDVRHGHEQQQLHVQLDDCGQLDRFLECVLVEQ